MKTKFRGIYLTMAPTRHDFASVVGEEVAEYFISSAVWHPAMTGNGDTFFGTARQYADAFEDEFDYTPNFVPALTSSTLISLLYAIQSAFLECSFVDPANMDVEQLLFDPSALDCPVDYADTCQASGNSTAGQCHFLSHFTCCAAANQQRLQHDKWMPLNAALLAMTHIHTTHPLTHLSNPQASRLAMT